MAVLFCGTVMAAFTAPWESRDKITIAAGAVGIVWYFIRQMRSAPTCEECGARFFPQKAKMPPRTAHIAASRSHLSVNRRCAAA